MKQEVFDMLFDTLLDANIDHGADTLDAANMLMHEYPEQFAAYNAKLPNEEDFEGDINPLRLQLMTARVEKQLKKKLKLIEE